MTRTVPLLPAGTRRPTHTWTLLLALSIASLGLVSAVDNAAYAVYAILNGQDPQVMTRVAQGGARHVFLWLIEARVTSCCVCALLAVITRRLVGPPATATHASWRAPGMVSAFWLAGTLVAIYGMSVFVPPLPRSVDVAAFLGFGLLAEELLFRGSLFALATRVLPTRPAIVIGWTAVLFSLQHLQYHHFQLGTHAATQLAYTLPFGLVLGYVRVKTQRLWPSVAVHVLNNALAVGRAILP